MKQFIADRGTGEPISLGASLVAGKKVRPDVISLLKEDHRVVLGWFEWYRQVQDTSMRQRIAGKICAALRAHMAGEEEIFYPLAGKHISDGDLVQHAIDEHESAKKLIEQLEQADPADGRHADLMSRLEQEIRSHVEEEETELMPRVRNSGMDVYEVGAAVAARRVDHLFARRNGASGQRPDHPREYPKMSISQEQAQEFYILGLKNIHSAVSEGKSLVEMQLKRVENYPKLRPKLESHLGEKNAQLERIEKILDRHDEAPSKTKDAVMKLGAAVSGMAHSSADDEIIKNSFATLALAKYEAAAYETLILFGEVAGDKAALPALQKSLSEERSMAAFIEENLRPTGMRFLQLRSEGAQASH